MKCYLEGLMRIGDPTTMVDQLETIPDDTLLWRYLSFSKLLALLSKKALYFSRADGFQDPFEGALGSTNDRDSVIGVYDRVANVIGAGFEAGPSGEAEPPAKGSHRIRITIDDKTKIVLEQMLQSVGGDRKKLGQLIAQNTGNKMKKDASDSFKEEYKLTFICCWHCADHESEAMWRLYAKDTAEGVAFQTTAGLLRSSVGDKSELIIRRVAYLDNYVYHPTHKQFSRFLTKRVAFEHESEVRAIVFDREAGVRNEPGIYVAV